MHNDDPTSKYHGITIRERHISIEMMKCHFNGYKLPITNGDPTTLGEALQGFVLWENNSFQLHYEILVLTQHV